MIIPLEDQSLYQVFNCGVCGNYYLTKHTGPASRCLVLHSPGSCCHESEYHLSCGQWDAINKLLSSIEDNKSLLSSTKQ